jgi:hypothetical protein
VDTPTASYPPSWVDRLTDRIDALPGPAWVPYVVAFVAVAVVTNAVAWAEGFVPLGTLSPYLNSLAVYLVGGYAAIHYLDAAAMRAWATFRPALRIADDEADRVAYALTTMPARPTLGWTILGIGVAVAYAAGQYGAPLDLAGEPIDLAGEPLTLGVVTAFGLVSFAGFAATIYHTLHQLRLIGRLHGYIDRIDLLNTDPLHAFSGVTAMTGGILLAFVYISLLTDPATLTNPALVVPFLFVVPLAVACFVVPLYGVNRRIVAEKARRMTAANRRLEEALIDLDRRADSRDLTEADALNKQLSSLLAERDVIGRTPTWPWAPETVRGFATALILPIALWLIFRFLDLQLL